MRLIGTIRHPAEAQRFSTFLKQKGIVHQIEVESNTDWADPEYGDKLCRVWIQEEDQTASAMDWFERFQENPYNPIFPPAERLTLGRITPLTESTAQKKSSSISRIAWSQQPMGWATRGILFICVALFILSQILMTPAPKEAPAIAYSAILRSPVDQSLMYDYPHAFEILDKIIRLYGVNKLSNPNELPSEGKYLLKQFYQVGYWKGVYDLVLNHNDQPLKDWTVDVSLFEKIRQGEVWRLVTPILLHADIFHIFFNMLWLIVLGKQVEQRAGPWKYIILVVVAGIFSNTMQYLMGGSTFLGISGVLCAMLTFIWMRQRQAPWEGYQLQKATIAFMMIFIFGIAGIQLVSFLLELTMGKSFSPGIANTAHLSGAAIGVVLGKLNFFGWKITK
jgi:GlpG protein